MRCSRFAQTPSLAIVSTTYRSRPVEFLKLCVAFQLLRPYITCTYDYSVILKLIAMQFELMELAGLFTFEQATCIHLCFGQHWFIRMCLCTRWAGVLVMLGRCCIVLLPCLSGRICLYRYVQLVSHLVVPCVPR